MRRALFILLFAVLPAAAEDEPLSKRWALQATPAELPALPDELYGPTWSYQPLRSRTGSGYSNYLTFRKPVGDQPAQVEYRQVTHPRAGQEDREMTRMLPLEVEKSLLEFDGVLRTAVLHDDKLVLNAGVPIGKHSWCLVHTESFSTLKVRVNEYLFDFADDPRTADEGKVTIKQTRSLFPDGKSQQWEHSATFTVDKQSEQQRELVVQALAGFNLPSVLVWKDRPYLALDEPNRRAVEYKLVMEVR